MGDTERSLPERASDTERSLPERASGFEEALRENVDATVRALADARSGGDAAETHRHAARLMDLLDRAAAHHIDTADRVSDELVSFARGFL